MPIGRRLMMAVADGDWWLAGGIDPANVVAVYQPIGAASLVASYTDLSGNGNDAAPGVAPAWNAVDGWIGDGATTYLKTGITITDANHSVFVRYSNASGDGSLLGMYFDSNTQFRIVHSQPSTAILYGYGSQSLITPFLGGGVVGIGGTRAYRNGIDEGISLSGFDPTGSIELYVLARQQGGVANTPTNGNIQAIVTYSVVISGAQATALSASMSAL